MFTITGYEPVKPCLLCNAQNGTFAVTCQRNEINGALCVKCLTKIVKLRTGQPKIQTATQEGIGAGSPA